MGNPDNRKNMMRFLCIDVGTTRFKAEIISEDGNIIAKSDAYYTTRTQFKGSTNRNTVNFRNHSYTKKAFSEALANTTKVLENDLKYISAVGVTGHGQTLVPISRSKAPAGIIFGYLQDGIVKYSKTVGKISGNPIHTMYIPILLYYKNEHPEIYTRTTLFLTPYDYIIYLLTGKPIFSISSPFLKPWEDEILQDLKIDRKKLPPIVYTGEPVGKTTSTAKTEYGIPEGIPVFATGADFAMGLLGSGTVRRGTSYMRFGTSAGINLCWDTPLHDKRILSYPHLIEGLWNISGILNSGGITLDWAIELLGLKRISNGIQNIKASSLFFPYLRGEKTPFWNPELKGAYFNLKGDESTFDLFTNITSGVLMGIKDSIKIMENLGVQFLYPTVISGWWSNKNWFVQLCADITGKPFTVLQSKDPELMGVAAVVAKELGIYGNLYEAVETMVNRKEVFQPDPKRMKHYEKLYRVFLLFRDRFYPH